MKVYHVVCSLENRFRSLSEAKEHYSKVIYPRIPNTAGI